MRMLWMMLLSLIAIMLTGCGPSPQEDFAQRVGQAMKSPTSDPSVVTPLVNMRRVALAAPDTADTPAITPDQLFDWAEATYPQFFPTREKTLTWSVYQFRYYKDTDVYLAVENGKQVVALGKPTSGEIINLGSIETFATLVKKNTFFQELPDAFSPLLYPFLQTYTEAIKLNLQVNKTVGIGTWIVTDLNSDGTDELILITQTMQPPNSQAIKITAPVYARIFILGLDPQLNKFIDLTSVFLEGEPILRAAPGANLVTDLNSDGRPDIIFSTHQEDGRNEDSGSMMEARPLLVLSQKKGKHRLISFGDPGWNLGIPNLIQNPSDLSIVAINTGNRGWKGYQFDGNTLQDSRLPVPAGGSFMVTITDRYGNKYLATTANYPDVYDVRALRLNADLSVKNEIRAPSSLVSLGLQNFTTWQGSKYEVKVVTDGLDTFISGGGYGISDACVIKINPKAEPKLLVYADMLRILDFAPGSNPVKFDNFKKYFFFNIENGYMEPETITIAGWEYQLNSWKIRCGDINADGYQDIWIEALRDGDNGTEPLVYLNNRQGSFNRIPKSRFPQFVTPEGQDNLGALFGDFDGDGIMDYVTIPTKGDGNSERNSMRFFRGLRHLELD